MSDNPERDELAAIAHGPAETRPITPIDEIPSPWQAVEDAVDRIAAAGYRRTQPAAEEEAKQVAAFIAAAVIEGGLAPMVRNPDITGDLSVRWSRRIVEMLLDQDLLAVARPAADDTTPVDDSTVERVARAMREDDIRAFDSENVAIVPWDKLDEEHDGPHGVKGRLRRYARVAVRALAGEDPK